MRNLTLILLIITFGTLWCYAQDDQKKYFPHDYSVIPPSPEVASLMKYIDFPVSHFTGQPDINIPLYTLQEGDITVPISISYHGGGIKVNEYAGFIGLGWSLIAGGSVSRTVNGLPDEINKRPGTPSNIRGFFHLTEDDKSFRNIIINKTQQYNPSNPANEYIKAIGLKGEPYGEGRVDMTNDVLKSFAICILCK